MQPNMQPNACPLVSMPYRKKRNLLDDRVDVANVDIDEKSCSDRLISHLTSAVSFILVRIIADTSSGENTFLERLSTATSTYGLPSLLVTAGMRSARESTHRQQSILQSQPNFGHQFTSNHARFENKQITATDKDVYMKSCKWLIGPY